MRNNMNVEGILRHIELKSKYNKSSKNKIKKDTNIITKIKPHNFFARNEININNSLHLLEHKKNRYITIKKATKLSINEVNDDIINKTEISKRNEYIMIKYEEYEDENLEGITRFLYNKGEKEYIYGVIESYFYIIKTFFQLQKVGIIYYNFSSEKMKFKDIYNPHCLLYDFESSLMERKINIKNANKNEIIEYFYNFIMKQQNFTFKPFEVHVLFYLYKMEEPYLCKYKITQIIDRYVENMGSILKGQTEKMIKQECHHFLKQFINKNKEETMIQLIIHYKTWDNYSVSILYLRLVENIIQGYKTQMIFMSKFQDILNQNLSQNPNQRMTIEKTINKFNDLFQYWN
jgi:hypothetical protein